MEIIEPISGMFKIIFLKFKQNYKIGVYQNKIHLMENNLINAGIRKYYSISREQIIFLLDIILRLIYWFSTNYVPKNGITNPTRNKELQNENFRK